MTRAGSLGQGGILGDFKLSVEQLKAQAICKEQNHLTTYHYKQTQMYFDGYMFQPNARAAKSRTNNLGRAGNIKQIGSRRPRR